ncbi:ECF RNA polymerase sigma factor SigE [Aquisphaera giovannonii]|uniref:ECF RNA polymerase sigma factor SigE n=1 Tax=Aquisphaera giovannonii TaxID=406548 RepID=A0A5B9W3C5_9BACT|nr:RNA polymerase sigma factor [Aquisphaera giovannonii]QEH34565.1 ECF RNA polymerase sigma factor SigE [Aquisphaera giovannonii]
MSDAGRLETLYSAGTSTGLSDGELLRLFLDRRERADRASRAAEAAFEVLVRRHGPMVLGVCRRYLDDPSDVDDAFQAIFLVLFRRAGAIRTGDSLGPWLHGVSRRIAARARAVAHRRNAREASCPVEPATDPAAEDRRREARETIDEELDRLPARYRNPIILCHLEGLTYQEAARRLGCPVGTVGVRLSRGREMLRARLSRRGAFLAAGPWAVGGDPASGVCPVSPSLVSATVRTVTRGDGGSTAVSTSITFLSEGFLRTMFTRRLGIAALALFPVGLLLRGGGLVLGQASARRGQRSATSPPGPATQSPAPRETDGGRTQRIRELLYTFRTYRVFSRDEEWARTVRELAGIGKDAVPELVAELDRTDRDGTLRALGFTLRAIEDPRSVPALIRAIPRTLRPPGSDCGVRILDPELLTFMKTHQDYKSDKADYVSCGRPVNEILTALERITGHAEFLDSTGKDVRDIFLDGTPEQQASQRTSFDQCRQRWEAWWMAHRGEFVTPEELRSVELPGRKEDLVEIAGLHRYGPLFPTGPDVRLGPVRMLRLSPVEYADAKSQIDFDTGRTFAVYEGMKAANRDDPKAFILRSIAEDRRHGIDARCQGLNIEGFDLHPWQVDNGRWGTIEEEIRRGGPLPLGREARSTLTASGGTATFLFTTREGGRGIVQVFSKDQDADQWRIRYRMWMTSDADPAARAVDGPAHAAPSRTPFGSIVTTTLEPPGSGRECSLNFRAGRKAAPPASLQPSELANVFSLTQAERFRRWCRDESIDLFCYELPGQPGALAGPAEEEQAPALRTRQPRAELLGMEMAARRIRPRSFEELTVEETRELLGRVPKEEPRIAWISAAPDLTEHPDTFAFQTREGSVGLLQMQADAKAPGKLTIRYRLQAHAERSDRDVTGRAPAEGLP